MSYRPEPSSYTQLLQRVLAAVVALLLLLLAQQAGRAAIAGIYGASAASIHKQVYRVHSRDSERALLHTGAEKISAARDALPRHPQYALMAAEFAVRRRQFDGETSNQALISAVSLIEQALAVAPVRADLWLRLALYRYQLLGALPITTQALGKSLAYGPYERGALLANARITFESGTHMEPKARLRAWEWVIFTVASYPNLARQIDAMARESGQYRQLHGLLAEDLLRRQQLYLREGAKRGN